MSLENRFLTRHFATLITALVSLAAVVVSVSQVIVAHTTRAREIEIAQLAQQFMRALERQPDDIKVVIQFAQL